MLYHYVVSGYIYASEQLRQTLFRLNKSLIFSESAALDLLLPWDEQQERPEFRGAKPEQWKCVLLKALNISHISLSIHLRYGQFSTSWFWDEDLGRALQNNSLRVNLNDMFFR